MQALYETTQLPVELIKLIGLYSEPVAVVTLTSDVGFYYRGMEFYIDEYWLMMRYDGSWETRICDAIEVRGYGSRLVYIDKEHIAHVVNLERGAWDVNHMYDRTWRNCHECKVGVTGYNLECNEIGFMIGGLMFLYDGTCLGTVGAREVHTDLKNLSKFRIEFSGVHLIVRDLKDRLIVRCHMPCYVERICGVRDFGDSVIIDDIHKYLLIDPLGFRCKEMLDKTTSRLSEINVGPCNHKWYSI